jgi:hypothetical protein
MGVPRLIQTIFDRDNEAKENWFDTDWNVQEFFYFSSKKADVELPVCLAEILEIAAEVSSPFSYARVDFYVQSGAPLLGEITFRPFGGFMRWIPDKVDFALGELLSLRN